MLTNLNPQAAQFLTDIERVEERVAAANKQVSSGLKITAASDAPDQISTLLQLRANLLHNTQIQSNLTLAQADANAADNALGSSIQLLDSAVTLAAQAGTATTDAAGRANIAQQIQTIQQQMVANSQTTVEGRYIFSGDQDKAPQYTWDPVAQNPSVAGPVSASTRLIENPAGGTFAASLTARQIFDDQDPATGVPTDDNAFNALSTLIKALQTNDAAGITDSMTLLKAASGHLNTMQAFYGNVENTLQSANAYAGNYAVQLQTQISRTEDADATNAAIELTQASTQLQAAFQMQAQMPHSSLFNYLG